MALLLLDSFSISKLDFKLMTKIKNEFPELKPLYDSIFKTARKCIKASRSYYLKKNLNMQNFKHEKRRILKQALLYFMLRTFKITINQNKENLFMN